MVVIKKIQQGIILVFSICLLSSCGVPKLIQNNFTLNYDGSSTSIDSLLNIKGYYVMSKTYIGGASEKPNYNGKYYQVLDTFYMNYLFFPDGMYVRNFGYGDGSPNSISKYFENIHNDSLGNRAKSFSISSYWGTYKIQNDTLVVQSINNPAPPKVWYAIEEYFKIIDSVTIIQIGEKPLHKMTEYDWKYWEEKQKERKYLPATFIPTSVLPSSNSWLKNEPWFWSNESKYLEWIEKNK